MKKNEELWLTYRQAGQRFGVSAQAIRQRAIRGNWQRKYNIKGEALIDISLLQIEEQSHENYIIDININKANRCSELWNALHDANDLLRHYVNSTSYKDNTYHSRMINMFDIILWGDKSNMPRSFK